MSMKISKILLYPVKGCRRIELDAAQVTPEGLATPDGMLLDRMFMIVDSSGKFISQRTHPELTTIVPILPGDSTFHYGDMDAKEGHKEACANPVVESDDKVLLYLKSPISTMPLLTIPVSPRSKTTDTVDVTVWGWKGNALDEGDEAAAWVSQVVGKSARLVRHLGPKAEGSFVRLVETSWGAPENSKTAFADGYPFLIASQRSLEELNKHLDVPISMHRFRPNIVVEGVSDPWEEDFWDEVGINDQVILKVVKPCDRCKVPTIDQESGQASPNEEPLRTLREIRSGKVLKWVEPPHNLPRSVIHAVFFASNCCCVHGAGTIIHNGDNFEIRNRRSTMQSTNS